MATDWAVKVRDVSKTFGVTKALNDVSITLDKGSSLALVGRNGAGKSTLVAIITGLLDADTGDVEFSGEGGREEQVGCVYQKSTLVPGLTAVENIALNRYPVNQIGMINWAGVREMGRKELAEWNLEGIADVLVENLDPVDRKIVEICRVLSLNPDVLLLDEPTAGLDFAGAERLFSHIEAARARGVSIIYVSHHLQEIFQVCDRAVVLRDGEVVLDHGLKGLSIEDIVEAMVGESNSDAQVELPPEPRNDLQPVLTVDDLSLEGQFDDVSFSLQAGECVGIAGLDGSGYIQIAEILSGLIRPTEGTITVSGTTFQPGQVQRTIAAGVGFVPEDRHIGGYVPAMSVAENVTLPMIYRIANRARVLRSKAREKLYEGLAAEWSIKAWGPGQPVEELSGGNQQKVVLARALSSDPSVLILMNPTAGVDVAAKQSIYATVRDLATKGKAIVIVSSDDADFGLCRRVLVMFQGKLHRVLEYPFSETDLAAAIQGK